MVGDSQSIPLGSAVAWNHQQVASSDESQQSTSYSVLAQGGCCEYDKRLFDAMNMLPYGVVSRSSDLVPLLSARLAAISTVKILCLPDF